MLKVMRYQYFMSLTTDEAKFDSRPKQKSPLSKKSSNIWFLTVDVSIHLVMGYYRRELTVGFILQARRARWSRRL
jgi:hypothetical protein